jgi:ubiquinone/menaquinone biosynthesis C-methylase UbiE
MDPFEVFKKEQKERWATFAPLEMFTMGAAVPLLRHARVQSGQRLLDVACGTGVVGVSAARLGARVTGLDLTPELLQHARENSKIAGVEIDWHEGDVESLPFEEGLFDVVVSQFGHMFAPRPDVAVKEMLRVLKCGGTIAFSTWPPELFLGRMFAIAGRYAPPPPPGMSSPFQWGDPNVVRERLGGLVKDVVFDRESLKMPALSPQHYRITSERNAGPLAKLVESLSANDPAKLAEFRREFEALAAEYFEGNGVRQSFLMTRAIKI